MAKGKLIANIGMTLDEARRQSSVKLEEGYSAQVFDFELAGSPMIAFKDCQYYLLRTGEGDQKLAEINIGIAPRKVTWSELGKAMREVEQRLIDDGWKPARYKEGVTTQESLNKMLSGEPPVDYLNVG